MTVASPTAVDASAAATGSGHLHASPSDAAIAAASSGGEGGRSPLFPASPSSAQFSAFAEAGSPSIRLRASVNGKSGEIEIYGDLDEYGFRKDHFNREMRQLKDAEHITVRINSDGGNAFDGFYIHDALRNHPARITTRVDNMAASAASIIMMAGDDREIAENGWVMIHNTWGNASGQAQDFERFAGLMRKMNESAAEIYAARTGLSIDEIVKMMDDETWMKAKEALSSKFATRILAPVSIAAKFDLSRHHNVPEAARRSLGLETAMSDKDTKKTDAAADAAAATTTETNVVEAEVAKATQGIFAKIIESLKPQAASTSTGTFGDPSGSAAAAKTDDAPDITAAVNAAVDKKLAALLSADSPVVQGLGAAFTAALTPVTQQLTALSTRVATDDAAHRAAQIDANINLLVTSGRLTPAQAKSTRTFLAAAGPALTDEAITAYLTDLAKSTPLTLAASAIGPVDEETGDVLDLPAELNPPPGSGIAIKDMAGLKIVRAAREKAEAGGGTAEQKYHRMREEIYRASGEGRGRSTLAFRDSAPAN